MSNTTRDKILAIIRESFYCTNRQSDEIADSIVAALAATPQQPAQAPVLSEELPPLPEPDNSYVIDGPDRFNGNQMRAYARAALSAIPKMRLAASDRDARDAANWRTLTEPMIDEYLEDYETRGEDDEGRDACYRPSEAVRFVIKDAFMGLMQEACDRAAAAKEAK